VERAWQRIQQVAAQFVDQQAEGAVQA
jgi:hypothetical protein